MTSRLCLALLLAMLVHVVYGQNDGEITGQIIDAESKQPLAGALVIIDKAAVSVADEDGTFALQVPAGQYEVLISYLGYEDKLLSAVSLKKEALSYSVGKVELSPVATSLEEVLISASPSNYKASFKGSNFFISPLAIKNTQPLSTEEVLRTIPGVNIVGDMGLSNRPNISIRGSWGRRSKKVLLLEDGSPAAPAPYIAPGAYYNPVSDRVRAVEVYKGADILRFGPNNMYGAVNYITALPPQKPHLRAKLIGGQRDYFTGLLSFGGTWNRVGSLVEAVYKRFDGFTDNSSVEVFNLNAKLFAELSPKQSLYFKISGQYENNQASLSSLTPLTFEQDPTQNPFDADIFSMRRYGLDLIHRWVPDDNIKLTSKVYATDFERDWWRQITNKIKASEARQYLGEAIFMDRYSYLQGVSFGDEDYLRVGRITNGRESTGDSRWIFTVVGLKETLNVDWSAWGQTQKLEVAFKLHRESRTVLGATRTRPEGGHPSPS